MKTKETKMMKKTRRMKKQNTQTHTQTCTIWQSCNQRGTEGVEQTMQNHCTFGAKPPCSFQRQPLRATRSTSLNITSEPTVSLRKAFSSLQEAERRRQSAGSRSRGERSHARQTRWPHCSLLRLRTRQALVQEQKAHTSHLQSGSPCLHTGKCWRSGDWAKGGRERSKVKLKILLLKKINGQGEGRRKNKV